MEKGSEMGDSDKGEEGGSEKQKDGESKKGRWDAE